LTSGTYELAKAGDIDVVAVGDRRAGEALADFADNRDTIRALVTGKPAVDIANRVTLRCACHIHIVAVGDLRARGAFVSCRGCIVDKVVAIVAREAGKAGLYIVRASACKPVIVAVGQYTFGCGGVFARDQL
jgi:hypothetical protein